MFSFSSKEPKHKHSEESKHANASLTTASPPALESKKTIAQLLLKHLNAFAPGPDRRAVASIIMQNVRSHNVDLQQTDSSTLEEISQVLALFAVPHGEPKDLLFTNSDLNRIIDESIPSLQREHNKLSRGNDVVSTIVGDFQTVITFFFLEIKRHNEKLLPETGMAAAAALEKIRSLFTWCDEADKSKEVGKVEISARCAAILLLWLCVAKPLKDFSDERQAEIESTWFAASNDSATRMTLLLVLPTLVVRKGNSLFSKSIMS